MIVLNLQDCQWRTVDGVDKFLGVFELVASDLKASSSSIGAVQEWIQKLAASHPSCLEALQTLQCLQPKQRMEPSQLLSDLQFFAEAVPGRIVPLP